MTAKNEISAAEKELSKNYKYFQHMQLEWERDHPSDHALIHHQNLVAFFESKRDAIHTGIRTYGWGNFSVQSVRERPIDFGHQHHVLF